MKLNILHEADSDLRSSSRRRDSSGKVANLVNKIRSGMVPEQHMQLAADLGHPIALNYAEDPIEPRDNKNPRRHLRAFLVKWYPLMENQLDEVYRRFYREWNTHIAPGYEYLADDYTEENERIINTNPPHLKAKVLDDWLSQYYGEPEQDLYYGIMYRYLNDVLMPQEFAAVG